MSKRILSVSYDVSLLATRGMLLEQRGYHVTSSLGFTQALAECRTSGFDLFILGHSIPDTDKLELIKTFRENCPAPILSLERHGEERVPSDFHASPDDPEKLIRTVDWILSANANGSQQRQPRREEFTHIADS
jgi:DNA-binding response OmpR family regulator